jgi:hypothetical protein
MGIANMHVNAASLSLKENYTPRTGSGQDNGATEEGSDVSRRHQSSSREDKKRSPAAGLCRRSAYPLLCSGSGSGGGGGPCACDLSGLEVKTAEIAAIESGRALSGGGIGRSFHE